MYSSSDFGKLWFLYVNQLVLTWSSIKNRIKQRYLKVPQGYYRKAFMQAHFKRFWFRKWVHQIGHPNSLYESRPFSWRLRLPHI